MRIDPKEHHKYNWLVHQLLTDFRIEDVWQLPVVLEPTHALELLQRQFTSAIEKVEVRGLAGWLFRLRFFLGHIFHWDPETEAATRLIPGSIRERYASFKNLTFNQLPDPGARDFIPVYTNEQESLAEIENATVHAAIHLGRVPLNNDQFTIQMTIYVKPKGVFGKIYMLLIKPFRWFIVYPALLKIIKIQWDTYLKSAD